MKEALRQVQGEFTIRAKDAQVFTSYFPTGIIRDISLTQVPGDALKYFDGKSAQFIDHREYRPNNFDAVWAIQHQNGDTTYAVHQNKTYYTTSDTESLIYIADIRKKALIGHGELRFGISNESIYFKGKPFVGYTSTEKKFRRTGLGTRRLFLMNALAEMIYDHPLYSDTMFSPEAQRVWDKLIERGEAIKFLEKGKLDRFVMTLYPVYMLD